MATTAHATSLRHLGRITWAIVVLLASISPATAATDPTFAGLAYGSNYRHKLDLYLPSGATEPAPVVLFIHGGGWVVGSKTQVAPHVDDLLERGFAVCSINYRFSSQANYPAQIHDCKAVVRWIRANAAQHNLDPSRVGVFGKSAGGHLASLLATTAGDPELEGTVGGNLEYSSAVSVLVDYYGPIDLFQMGEHNRSATSEESRLIGHHIADINDNLDNPAYADLVALVVSASPNQHASADDPPALILHGDADTLVPLEQGQLFHDALTGAGVVSKLRRLEGMPHDVVPEAEVQYTYNFLVEHLVQTSASCEGDLDGSGAVNTDDLLLLFVSWGDPGGPADLTSDGVVDGADFVALLGAWGPCQE